MEIQNDEMKEGSVGAQEVGKASEKEHAELLTSGWTRVRHVGKRVLQVFVIISVLLAVIRIPHAIEVRQTVPLVAKIHATKLTMDDVMGTNLPPEPGSEANMTVAGVDANKNGIRDDVELAIFKEYATSSKTRAVLLQYALALQMEFTQPLVNTETVIAVAQEVGRSSSCIGKIFSRENLNVFMQESNKLQIFLESQQLNTTERHRYQKSFYNDHLRSYGAIRENICDIDLTTLQD